VAAGAATGIADQRQKRLLMNINEDIVKTLSQGYSPEEIEALFI
jgi:hypothetical protein